VGDLIIGIAISEVVRIGIFITCKDDPSKAASYRRGGSRGAYIPFLEGWGSSHQSSFLGLSCGQSWSPWRRWCLYDLFRAQWWTAQVRLQNDRSRLHNTTSGAIHSWRCGLALHYSLQEHQAERNDRLIGKLLQWTSSWNSSLEGVDRREPRRGRTLGIRTCSWETRAKILEQGTGEGTSL
jgi:hypothetical protein